MNRGLLLLLLLTLGCPTTSLAQWCGAAINGNIDFGHVNLEANTSTVGEVRVWCNGASTPYVRVCIALGAPLDGSWDPRHMQGPSNSRMAYNIYSDASYTQIWGNGMSAQAPQVAVDMTMESWGGGETAVPYYARVPPQSHLPVGNYWVNFTGADTAVRTIGFHTAPPPCDTSWPITATFNFGVVAMLDASCEVTAAPLNFGSLGNLESNVEAQSTISVNCPPNVAYSISLNAGQGSGATVAERRLTRLQGNETLRYQLYSDSGRRVLWGDGTAGTGTVSGTGDGNVQPQTVYGTLVAQPVGASGEYRDTVTVTVTY